MTTRRERMEARLEKRQAWAAARTAKAESALSTALDMARAIPFGQPIMVGHYSEKRDRNYRGRIASKFERAAESQDMAAHHAAKADGIAAQLEGSIFSDDDDAIPALEAKIARLEAQQERDKKTNAAYKKGGIAALQAAGFVANTPEAAASLEKSMALCWDRRPVAGFTLSNRNATIRNAKKRIEIIKAREARTAKAEAAGGVLIEGTDYVRVTFTEKPERATLDALRAAGFRWGGGSWMGCREKLPARVTDAAAPAAPTRLDERD